MSPQNSSVSAPKPLLNNTSEFSGPHGCGEERSGSSRTFSEEPGPSASSSHERASDHLPQNGKQDKLPKEPNTDRSFTHGFHKTDECPVDSCGELGPILESNRDHVNTSICDTPNVDCVEATREMVNLCAHSSVFTDAPVCISGAASGDERTRQARVDSGDAVAQSHRTDCSKPTILPSVSKSESVSASLQSVPMDVRLTNELNLQNPASCVQAFSSEGRSDCSMGALQHSDEASGGQKIYGEAEADSGACWRSVSSSSPSNSISYDSSSQKEVSETSRLENSVAVELLMSAEKLSFENDGSKESVASGGKLPYDRCRVDSVECMVAAGDAVEDQSQCFLEHKSLRSCLAAQGGSAGLENSVPSSNSLPAAARPFDSGRAACATDVLQSNADQPKSEQIHQTNQLFSRNSEENVAPRVASCAGECAPEVMAEEISSRVRKRSRRRRSSSLLGSCWLNRRNVLVSTWRRFWRWCGSSERRPNEPSSEAVRTLSRSVCGSGSPPGSAEASGAGVGCPAGKPDAATNRHVYADRPNPLLDSPALSMKSFKGAMQAAASMAGKGAKVSPVDESNNASTVNIGAACSGQGVASRRNSSSSSFKVLSKARRGSCAKLTSSNSSSSADDNASHSNPSKGSKTEIAAVVKAAAENLMAHAKKQTKSKPPPEGDVHDPGLLEAAEEIPAEEMSGADPLPPAVGNGRGDHMRKVRSRRLMKEFQDLTKISQSTTNPVFSVALVNDCLYEWKVKLHRIDQDSFLHRDMIAFGVPFILFSMTFPDNFPFHPPFLRVLSPRIEKGFVMEGGAICMELLTPRGWASAYTIEAIIMQLAASLVKGHARISRKPLKDFNQKAAEASFKSLVRTHEKYGWVTPPLADG